MVGREYKDDRGWTLEGSGRTFSASVVSNKRLSDHIASSRYGVMVAKSPSKLCLLPNQVKRSYTGLMLPLSMDDFLVQCPRAMLKEGAVAINGGGNHDVGSYGYHSS
ncbi:hypothetical protein NC651_032626 [Populus alba x Populus x berolinensis]|nr:hypothetical protein NC651_032626 [Populus alba x Populus x berolinensis]